MAFLHIDVLKAQIAQVVKHIADVRRSAQKDVMALTVCCSVCVRTLPCVTQHLADVTVQMAGLARCVTNVCMTS